MDDYLERMRQSKGSSFQILSKKKNKSEKVEKVPNFSEEEIYVEYEEPSGFKAWFTSLFSPSRNQSDILDEDLPEEIREDLEGLEDEMEDIEEEIEDLEEKRENALVRFLNTMRLSRRRKQSPTKDELLEEVVPVIDEDVKETLKILHKWLERLPNHELRAFKTSEDFQKYRNILEKYDLIKK